MYRARAVARRQQKGPRGVFSENFEGPYLGEKSTRGREINTTLLGVSRGARLDTWRTPL